MIEFYADRTQPLIGPVVMLPQAGSATGGSKRPLNSYAVLRDGYSVLFDAPFSWVVDGVQRLADDGHPPLACVLSHRDLAASGDAFADLASEFGVSILLHPDDQATVAAKEADVAWGDPTTGQGAAILADADLELIHIPGHSPGSVMLYLADDGGVVLAGDSAVGPGPEQADQTPRLQRPIKADEDPRFIETWRRTISRLPIAAVLPLHGQGYHARDHDDFAGVVANNWRGEPMDPRKA